MTKAQLLDLLQLLSALESWSFIQSVRFCPDGVLNDLLESI